MGRRKGEQRFAFAHPTWLKERITSKEEMIRLTTAWYEVRSDTAINVDWQFTTKEARIKLKQLYLSIKT